MKLSELKTIDVQAKEWFDAQNGNSYFSALVTLNFGASDEERLSLPFQYGYGDHYQDIAADAIRERFPRAKFPRSEPLWRWCETRGIALRADKHTGCRKLDVESFAA